MQIVALFNLETTLLEHFSLSPHTAHEGGMFDVELMEHLQAGHDHDALYELPHQHFGLSPTAHPGGHQDVGSAGQGTGATVPATLGYRVVLR